MPLMYALWRLTIFPRSNHESSASVAVHASKRDGEALVSADDMVAKLRHHQHQRDEKRDEISRIDASSALFPIHRSSCAAIPSRLARWLERQSCVSALAR